MALGTPWTWTDAVIWVLLTISVVAYAWAGRKSGETPSTRQVVCFAAAIVLLVGTLTWPFGEIAAQQLLSALVIQRLVLMLAVPPLLVAGCPTAIVERLTRPRVVDLAVQTCARPIVAVAVVTVCAIATLTTPAVQFQATTPLARGAFDVGLVAVGFVLWAPVLRGFPGVHRPSALGRAGYLMAQSIVPSFLAVVWIFARHSLYPVFNHPSATWGISPLLDQQLAGFIAKLGTIAVLWTVAFFTLHRAQLVDDVEPDPLRWVDVARELERADRGRSSGAWRPVARGLRLTEPTVPGDVDRSDL
jgi:cytochrome c oxidase assembly factor CtaG